MAPAERYDVLVNFSEWSGTRLILYNDAPTPYSGPDSDDAVPLTEVMLFVVNLSVTERVSGAADAVEGRTPHPVHDPMDEHTRRLSSTDASVVRQIDMREVVDAATGRTKLLLEQQECDSGISIYPGLNVTEEWDFVNTTPDYHPMVCLTISAWACCT